MTNPAYVQPGAPSIPLAYFKLKNSESYRFWRGRRLIDLKKGVIHAVLSSEDVQYFRSRPDVIAECDAQGSILGAAAPGALDPKKAKSYRTYGAPAPGMPGKAPAPPVPVLVGKQAVAGPPQPPITFIPPAPSVPGSQQVAVTAPLAPPSVPPPPPLDRKARSSKAQAAIKQLEAEQNAQPISPIEEVDSSGKTQANLPVRR